MNARPRLAMLLVVVALAGCAGESNDGDGDGVPNAEDAFPHDPREFRDTDKDGEGDRADGDDDGDGVADERDYAPARNAHLNVTLESIALIDTVGDGETTRVAFVLESDGRALARWPLDGGFEARHDEELPLHVNATIDMPDDVPTTRLQLRVLAGERLSTTLDVNPVPDEDALSWTYTTASGVVAGSSAAGPASGRGDGGSAPDASLRYLVTSAR